MGLVLILTGGAVVVLKAYNIAKAASPEIFTAAMAGLRQQAAVVATLAAMVFLLLDALEKGKVALSLLSSAGIAAAPAPAAAAAAAGVPGMPFGRPTGMATAITAGP